MKRTVVCLLACFVLAACGTARLAPGAVSPASTAEIQEERPRVLASPAPGTLYVDPSVDWGEISPYVYGTNYGPMHAVPLDMLPLVQESGLMALRWPGGAWTDTVDMKPFQIDQFKDFWEMLGATPTISVRLLNGAPETAAELVRYTNIEKGYGVRYWSIGNEPTLFESQSRQAYDTVRFNQEWRAIAEAMKAADPSIQLMGPELHQWAANLEATPKDSSGRDWMTEFLKANGDLVDVVTVHRYPLFRSGGQAVAVDEMRKNTEEWPAEVQYLREIVREITGRDLPVAFTEVNSSPTGSMGGEASPDSFYNAIWYADVLGRMISEDVFMVNQWVLSQRTTGLGLIYGNEARPTLYTFHLYKHFGNQQVGAASDLDEVTVYAAKREDGKLTIMVINLADTEQRAPLKIEGRQPASVEVWRLDAEHEAENLGEQAWPADGVVVLPGQSATMYVIGE